MTDQPLDESFLATGLCFIDVAASLEASPDEVWAGFADLNQSVFLPGFRAERSGPLPGTVGTTRTVSTLGGRLTFEEFYFLWDDTQRRRAFYVTGHRHPLFTQLAIAEEHHVLPRPGGGSILVWRLITERTPRLQLASKALTPALSRLVTRRFVNRFDGRPGKATESTETTRR
ncbi:hypothetical protein ACLTEW_17660 [Gordonia lacunae]|uniref:hypothetical protein n=1 Tax=Gordonia lacunae TaxID=417102 RepID=UPI0039E68764